MTPSDPKTTSAWHYSESDFKSYFSGAMSEKLAEELETHLGQCSLCMRSAGHMSDSFLAFEQWTAEAHRAAYQRVQTEPVLTETLSAGNEIDSAVALTSAAITAVQEIAEAEPVGDLRSRLDDWLQALHEGVAGAVQFAFEKGNLSNVLESVKLAFEVSFGGPALATGGAIRTRGAVRTRGSAHVRKPKVTVIPAGPGEFRIRVDHLPSGPLPRVVIKPPTGRAILKDLTLSADQTYAFTQVQNLPLEGKFIFLLEPVKSGRS